MLIGTRGTGPNDNEGPGEVYVIFGHSGGWDAVYNFSELATLDEGNSSSSSTSAGYQAMGLSQDFHQLDFRTTIEDEGEKIDLPLIMNKKAVSATSIGDDIIIDYEISNTLVEDVSFHYDYG